MNRMVSGIKPSGHLTLGNYLGAIKNFVELQKEYEMFVFIANLHSITVPYENNELVLNTKELAAMYIACGLDPKKSTLFVQSDVLEHAQLGHIVLCNTTMGELQKMTQYKDKSGKGGIKMPNGTTAIPTGLLTYPTLMAADILMYHPTHVPVGDDQKQHVELTRNVAERMNKKFGQMFTVPAPTIAKVGARIMDLQNPTSKMSKSASSKGTIYLNEDPAAAATKIRKAKTDSDNLVKFDKENKPGVANLMNIYSGLTNLSFEGIEAKYEGLGYKEFKTDLADIVEEKLTQIQTKFKEVSDFDNLDKILTAGAAKARVIAEKTLTTVQNQTGVNYVKR